MLQSMEGHFVWRKGVKERGKSPRSGEMVGTKPVGWWRTRWGGGKTKCERRRGNFFTKKSPMY